MNEPNENEESCTKSKTQKSLQIQTDFMQSMTNAILRFIDKNADCTKADAERSVFLSLGYNPSIETNSDIDYFRRKHIMRRRDAIRAIRIKEMHKNVLSQFPNLSSDQVLTHLTKELNELFLPSPSPPPHNNKCTFSKKHFQPIEKKQSESAKMEKLKDLISTSSNSNCEKMQNVNYSINHGHDHIKNVNLENENDEKNNFVREQKIILKTAKHIKSCFLKDRYIESKKNDYDDVMDRVNGFHSNIFVYPQTVSNQFFVCDDEVAQKIKMHKKSTKKKEKITKKKKIWKQ